MQNFYKTTLELDKILNQAAQLCVCPESAEILLASEPCCAAQEERLALAKTDAIYSLLLKNGGPPLRKVEGVERMVAHAAKGGLLSMEELLHIAAALFNFDCLQQWYGGAQQKDLPTDDLFFALSPQPTLERNITASILSPEEMADTASSTLSDLRRKIRATELSIRAKLEGIIKGSNSGKYLQDSVVTLRNGRYVIPVRAEYKTAVSGIVHDVSSTGATVFIEPTAVAEANAHILQLRAQEQQEITRILGLFSDQVANLKPVLDHSYAAMLQIDVLLAKAKLALRMDAVAPVVRDTFSIALKSARHPLIEKERVVAIDISLGEEYDTMIVTGPNTGGKTVALKTTGLLCAMAQHGFLIPAAQQSAVCCFDEYLVDIGDEQSIEQNLSTFSGHIKRIADILKWAGPGTLTLLDELGAGTDPVEGAALAVSLIESLRSRGTLLIATTHYAELKVYALETPGVVNAGCAFDVETLMPTYRLIIGLPGKSNAFIISEKLGIPAEILDRAREHMSSDSKRLNLVLGQLEDLRAQLQAAQQEAEDATLKAKQTLENAQRREEEQKKQAEREQEAARAQARLLIENVQREAYALSDELQKLNKDDAKTAAQRLQRAREIARKDTQDILNAQSGAMPASSRKPLKDVEIGDEVFVFDLSRDAIVTARPDKDGQVEVQVGVLKTKVPLSGLAAPDKKKDMPARKKRQNSYNNHTKIQLDNSRNISMEINLLGYNVEDALKETDRFLDTAVLRGQNTVYIIHGIGTGALRSAIQKHLRTHKAVKSFRPGRYGEGEAGVTVVELK